MEEATVVDVISTRFQIAKSEKAKEEASKDENGEPTYRSCDPFETANGVKDVLEVVYDKEAKEWKPTAGSSSTRIRTIVPHEGRPE